MLDDPERRKTVDSQGILGILGSLPEQLEEGSRLAGDLDVQLDEDGRLVVFGMGGSAIAGDLAAAVAHDGGYPVQVVRDLDLPPGLGPKDFLVFTSYSGNTWETLSCYRQALAQDCSSLAISSGGEMRESALAKGSPHLRIPSGLPPRGALGYLVAPLLVLLASVVPDLGERLEEAIRFLARRRERWAPAAPTSGNEAKAMALAILGKSPIVYASTRLGGVARRWQTQLNEMAKVLAWSSTFPEADHNELVGWMEDPDAVRFAPIVLMVRENPLLELQMMETRTMMEGKVPVQVVKASDASFLSQVFELVHLGDMVSAYLAIARGVDPHPVIPIEKLKEAVQARRDAQE